MTDWPTIFLAITAGAAVIGALSAVIIGVQQVTVAARKNYTEIFVRPYADGVANLIIVRNASSYPIYITRYIINGIATDTGSTAVPNDTDSWYKAAVPQSAIDSEKFTLTVYFEDYSGKKYSAESSGNLVGGNWSIHSKKRIVTDD